MTCPCMTRPPGVGGPRSSREGHSFPPTSSVAFGHHRSIVMQKFRNYNAFPRSSLSCLFVCCVVELRRSGRRVSVTGLNRIQRHTSTRDTEFYGEQAQKPMCGSALVLARRGSVAGETVKADVSPLLFLSTKSNPGAGGPRAGKGCSGASVGLTPRMYPARTTHLSTLSIPPFPLQHEKGINPRPHPNTQRKVF